MAILASDNFNRANESPLASPWINQGGANTARIVSNQLAVTTASTDVVYSYGGVSWPNNQKTTVRAAVLVDAGNFDAGPAVRIQSGGGGDYYWFNLSSFIFTIYKVTDFSFSPLVTDTTSGITANDLMALDVTGNVLTAFVNGIQVLTITDNSSPYVSGLAGIAMFGGTERIDDFQGEGAASGQASRAMFYSRLRRN